MSSSKPAMPGMPRSNQATSQLSWRNGKKDYRTKKGQKTFSALFPTRNQKHDAHPLIRTIYFQSGDHAKMTFIIRGEFKIMRDCSSSDERVGNHQPMALAIGHHEFIGLR